MTKSDLASPDKLLELYGHLDIPYVVTSRQELEADDTADHVREHLDGKITAFVGHSGVGKTTLVNALVPEDLRRTTGHVNAVTGRGRHTDLGTGPPWRTRTAAGWWTPRAYGRSVSPTSTPRGSSTPSRIWCRAPRAARVRAVTTSRTARWTSGWRTVTRTRPGSTPCAGCSRHANDGKATDLRVVCAPLYPVSA